MEKYILFFCFCYFSLNSQEYIKSLKRYDIEIPDSSKENTPLDISKIRIYDNFAYFVGRQYLIDENNLSNYIMRYDLINNQLYYTKSIFSTLNSIEYTILSSFIKSSGNIYLYLSLDQLPDFYNQGYQNQVLLSQITIDSLIPKIIRPDRKPAKGLAYNDSLICFTSINGNNSYLNIYNTSSETYSEIRLDSAFNEVLFSYPYSNGFDAYGTDAHFRFSIIKENKIYFTTCLVNNTINDQQENLFSYDFQNNIFETLFSSSDSLFSHRFHMLYENDGVVKLMYIKAHPNNTSELFELSINNNTLSSKKVLTLPLSYLFEMNVLYIDPSENIKNIHFITKTGFLQDSLYFVNINNDQSVYRSKSQPTFSSFLSPPVLVFQNRIIIPQYKRIQNLDLSNDLIQQINVYDQNFELIYSYTDSILSYKDVFGERCNKIIYGEYIIENDSLFFYGVLSNYSCFSNVGINPFDRFRIVKYYIDINSIQGISETYSKDFTRVFPNPGHHSFSLRNERFKGTANISVSNQLGQLVYQTQQNQPDMTIETSHWPAGIYFVTVTNSNSVQTLKWIKQ